MSDFKKGSFLSFKSEDCLMPILLWLHPSDKLQMIESIDNVIFAELPDKEKYPRLFEAITKFMMHGPCGKSNPNSPCMKEGKCSKFFFFSLFFWSLACWLGKVGFFYCSM